MDKMYFWLIREFYFFIWNLVLNWVYLCIAANSFYFSGVAGLLINPKWIILKMKVTNIKQIMTVVVISAEKFDKNIKFDL